MRRVIISSIALVLIIGGIVLAAVPLFSNQSYSNKQKHRIEQFIEKCSEAAVTEPISETKPDDKNVQVAAMYNKEPLKLDLKRLREDVITYNKIIYREKQCNLKDKSSYQVASLNIYDYGFQDGIYGYLSVDKLGLNMPIYLGANDYNMSLGAAHMSQTSIPYGGENTHSVIAGHCGYGYMNYFRYIDSLQNGDDVKVTTPFGQLGYKVIDKVIIKPSEFEPLRIKKGEDLLTLFTCYPYPTNKFRCCVICERSLNE